MRKTTQRAATARQRRVRGFAETVPEQVTYELEHRTGHSVPVRTPRPVRNGIPSIPYLPKDPGARARLLAALRELNRD